MSLEVFPSFKERLSRNIKTKKLKDVSVGILIRILYSSLDLPGRFHFPQFELFTEEMFVKELKEVLSEDYKHNDYYKENYPNWKELNEEYKKILDMMGKGREEFVAACDRLMELQKTQNSYIRHNLFLDLQGGVAELNPCCK